MDGTGQFSSLIPMNMGGNIVTLPSRHFSVDELLSEVERNRVGSVIIVGQAFAGPMLEALDAEPGRYDLSSVVMVSSSGVMWSQDNKDGLLRHLPQARSCCSAAGRCASTRAARRCSPRRSRRR